MAKGKRASEALGSTPWERSRRNLSTSEGVPGHATGALGPTWRWRRCILPGCRSQHRHVVQNSQVCKCRLQAGNNPAPCLSHTPRKMLCHQKTATNYHELQDKTQMSLFTHVSAGLPLQIGADSQKDSFIRKGNSSDFEPPQKEVLLRKKCYF